jgi:hypothetical protein
MANTLTVPIGRRPSVAVLLASPFTTSWMVPSPPAAIIFSKPSRTACRANVSASPGAFVMQTVHPFANDSTLARQRFALSLRAAGFRITTVLFTTGGESEAGFDLFFKLGLRNVWA